ncbi:DUF6090 family protein [Maribacter cobaltidurans]|uniref:Uncharacterized protein n=1 Tax=Maribacter cobaltidurans TaxID=1178778 RepID=A0A223V8U1_9FLAO|nr:DUF6090 family protein [Maribacter cobaltidurans]ASV31801.1 hypothetical protein CJ263_17140 [Maribacter cobaltidurans]GGD84714.1 hypothetical protein GCM10011412_23060 [Maribacter cobaltidurans]|tara:strand:- start:4811 stop:5566 length:756 start_codon:yes stop_codon:yes gene_type:complete
MIKFFRKIRQNLLAEGKTTKYFKYALGEIILVVIGILIALQVNNWNEERKNNEVKQSLVENLIADLKEDIQNLETLNTINTNAENEGFYLASYLDDSLKEIDTLRLTNSIVFCGYIPNKSLISSTYNDLINSNNIHLFNDVKLKKLLDEYYVNNSWFQLLNSRILKTVWYDYRDEMSKFHSPKLYQDFYTFQKPIESNVSKYHVQWNQIKNNDYLNTQVGMIGAYRILIRQDFEKYTQKAKTILKYLEETK